MSTNDLRNTLIQRLMNDYRRHGCSSTLQIGKVTIYVRERCHSRVQKQHTVDVGCNWPSIGTVDPEQTAEFAKDMQNAADIARETEKRLEQAGCIIYRSI
jgi:hypothetical protein